MRLSPRACISAAVLAIVASAASAQKGEIQVGGVGSYGTSDAAGAGAGMVLGVAAGRIAYVGLRWTYFAGTTEPRGPAPPAEVTTRSHVFALDLGVQIPVGRLEVVPGMSVGFVRFAQRVRAPAGGGSTVEHETEFLAVPGVAVAVQAGSMSLIPELRYSLAGSPSSLPWRVSHRGLLLSLRLVITFEVGRIRQ
ncbi:MAG: hypothetical protein ACREMW_05665 [Gemmatimonadales bacterium]